MWLGICLLVLVPATWACTYNGQTYKNEETGKTGYFTFKCLIKQNKAWEIKITGCIWKRTGETLQVGETKTVKNRTGRCYQDGDVTRFEEEFECKENCDLKERGVEKGGQSGGTPQGTGSTTTGENVRTGGDNVQKPRPQTRTQTGTQTQKRTLMCNYNGKKYTNNESFREGHFKFICTTGGQGWKIDVTACFVKEKEGTEVEMRVGEERKLVEMFARCYKDGDMTLFELKPLKEMQPQPAVGTKTEPKVKVDFTQDSRADTQMKQPQEVRPEKVKKMLTMLVEGVVKKSQTEMTKPEKTLPKDKTQPEKPDTTMPDMKQEKPTELATAATKVGKAVAKATKKRNILCRHREKEYKDGQVWTEDYFKYKCTVEKFTWKVEVTTCYWPRFTLDLPIGENLSRGGWTATCTPKGDGRVDFREKRDQ